MNAPLISHFAIQADDVDRARAFYEKTFGWTFRAWGPPNFFQVDDDGPIKGALQERRALVDRPTQGFECTVAVDDVAATLEAAQAAGGTVVMEPTIIEGVGELAFIQDTEGHVIGAMRYE